MANIPIQITNGEKFNHLTFLSFDESSIHRFNSKKKGIFECDCGNIVSKRISDIIYLNKNCTKTCGKKECEFFQKSLFRPDSCIKSVERLYYAYRHHSQSVNRDFKLSLEQFSEIIKQNCFYCGNKPKTRNRNKYNSLVYNGVDRKDNKIGYIMENCVPCCPDCNFAKNRESVNKFVEICERVASHWRNQDEDFSI